MSQVAIHKWEDSKSIPQTVLDKIRSLKEAIQQRAFSLFQSRNPDRGSELDDWVQAERDVVWVPASELLDTGNEIRARIALPGFDAKDIEVSATPEEIVVRAETTHTHEGENARVAFCEFSGKTLFRQMSLPCRIDVDQVSATLDKGILQVIAPKPAPKQIPATV
jgi:HSP20 family protein